MTSDILLDINQKDFLYADDIASRTFFSAEYGKHQIGGDTGSYLDVIIPEGYYITPSRLDVYVKVPYIPVNGLFSVRFLQKHGSDYDIIQVYGQDSLLASRYVDGEKTALFACQLLAIDIDGLLRIHCISAEEGCVMFQASDSDFSVGDADRQIAELMMLCFPGKNYRYPTVGVGAARFLGTIIERTTAADDILREMDGDSQGVRSVYYDPDLQKLRISTDEYSSRQKIEKVDVDGLDLTAFEP
jgi:hypothetical protein